MRVLKKLTGHITVGFNKKRCYYRFRSNKRDLKVNKTFTSLKTLRTFLRYKGFEYELVYSNEIIANAIEMVCCGKGMRAVAREMNIPIHLIDKWYNSLYLPEINFHGYRYILTYESLLNDDLQDAA